MTVTRRGFCYVAGVSGDPTTANSTEYEDGSFIVESYDLPIDGLSNDTYYRVRAYAIADGNTYYGNTVTVKTLSSSGPRQPGNVKHTGLIVAEGFNSSKEGNTYKSDYWKDPFIKKVR
jgi:hypothetical protein